MRERKVIKITKLKLPKIKQKIISSEKYNEEPEEILVIINRKGEKSLKIISLICK